MTGTQRNYWEGGRKPFGRLKRFVQLQKFKKYKLNKNNDVTGHRFVRNNDSDAC